MARANHRPRKDFHAFLLVLRAEQPSLTEMEHAERQRGEVLADVLEEWLRTNEARFAPPRKRGLFGSAPAPPRILYETDAACLAVLRERGVAIPDGLTLVTVDELRAWLDDHPDAMEALYPIVSSFFTSGLPTSLYRRALARYPLRPGEEHYLHVRSVWTSPTSGNGSDDLWKCDGERLRLLEPRFTQWRK